ncbi:MAG TPA: hypothetical protein VF384_08355 [Planctomycetota bacterium]
MQRAVPLLYSLLAGCSSVAWSPPPAGLPTQWRHYQLFVGEHAMVLARDGDAAAEVHERVAAAAATIGDCTGKAPAGGLLIALSAEDPLPVADHAAYGEALRRWQAGLGQGPSSSQPMSFSLRTKPGKSVDVDPALVMHLIAAGIPKDDRTLDLPAELLERSSFAAIVPTDTCLEATCTTLFDAAAEAEGVSSLTITLLSLVAGHPVTMMTTHAGKAVDTVLYETWLSALRVDAATAAMVRARAELPTTSNQHAAATASGEDLTRYVQELWKDMRQPTGGSPFFLVPRPRGPEQAAVPYGQWVAVVDLGPAFDDSLPRIVAEAGKAYAPLRITTAIPGRAEAEQLAAIHRKHGDGAVLICADLPEQAAALLAAHAFFVGGADTKQALAVARHYDADAELALIERTLASDRN